MNGRLQGMSDELLGQALAGVAPDLAWPATPDLARAVAETITQRERVPGLAPPRLWMPSRRRVVVLIAAAILVLAAAAVAAKLVIDLGAVSVQVIPGRPTALPSAPATDADFGTPVSMDRAARIAGFAPLVPDGLGAPDRVWVDRGAVSYTGETASRIVLAWRPGPGLPPIAGSTWGAVLMQFEGSTDSAVKLVFEEGNRLGEAYVNGTPAYWVTGEHELDLLTPSGVQAVRVTGQVLLWNDQGLALRLETDLDKAQAIRIAESAGP